MIADTIKKYYYDPETGFISSQRLYEKMKAEGYKVTLEQVKDVVEKQVTYQTHKQVQVRKKNFEKIVSPSKNNNWQMDLLDVSKYSKFNKGNNWLMNTVDVYTRKAHSVPMKSKTTGESLRAFKETMKELGTPKNLNTDLESAFLSKEFQSLLNENKIEHWKFDPDKKRNNAIVERFNRTMREVMAKYFYARDTKKYLDVLDELLKNYNNSEHRTIGTTPNQVWNGKEKPLGDSITEKFDDIDESKLIQDIKVGDWVRVIKQYDIFKKRSAEKAYSKTLYEVIKKEGKRFTVKSKKGETQERVGWELQKIDPEKVEEFEGKKDNQKNAFKKQEESKKIDRALNKEGIERNDDTSSRTLRSDKRVLRFSKK